MVIGTGFGRQHADWISQCAGASVEFIGYRLDKDRARAVAGEFGARVTADPVAVIIAGEVDAVAVVSPPHTHEEYLLAGLAAGLRVVSDKPLTDTLPAAARLVEAAGAASTMVTFQWRANPALRELRRLCAGELGELVHLGLEFRHEFLAGPQTGWLWRHRWQTGGAGALCDQGVHLFDLLGWLAPGAWTVLAGSAAVVWPRRASAGGVVECETEDVADLLLGVIGDATRARVFVSRVTAGCRSLRVTAQGTLASAEVVASPDDGSATLTRYSPDVASPTVTAFEPHAMNPYAVFLSDSPGDVASFADGYAAQVLLAEALRAGCGKPVVLSPPGQNRGSTEWSDSGVD